MTLPNGRRADILALRPDAGFVCIEVKSGARDFLADFEANGRIVRDGSDLPRLARARKIEKLATAFGVRPAT